MKTLLDVCKFLKAAGTYYLATVDGDKPRVRPFGTAHIYNGKLYIQTGKKKAVSHQIAANPNVEICAMADGDWLRIEGELVEDDDRAAKFRCLMPTLSLRLCMMRMTATRRYFTLKCHRYPVIVHKVAGNVEFLINKT